MCLCVWQLHKAGATRKSASKYLATQADRHSGRPVTQADIHLDRRGRRRVVDHRNKHSSVNLRHSSVNLRHNKSSTPYVNISQTYLQHIYKPLINEVKEADLYSAFIVAPHTQGAQVRITQCYLQITPSLPLLHNRSPDDTFPD